MCTIHTKIPLPHPPWTSLKIKQKSLNKKSTERLPIRFTPQPTQVPSPRQILFASTRPRIGCSRPSWAWLPTNGWPPLAQRIQVLNLCPPRLRFRLKTVCILFFFAISSLGILELRPPIFWFILWLGLRLVRHMMHSVLRPYFAPFECCWVEYGRDNATWSDDHLNHKYRQSPKSSITANECTHTMINIVNHAMNNVNGMINIVNRHMNDINSPISIVHHPTNIPTIPQPPRCWRRTFGTL